MLEREGLGQISRHLGRSRACRRVNFSGFVRSLAAALDLPLHLPSGPCPATSVSPGAR